MMSVRYRTIGSSSHSQCSIPYSSFFVREDLTRSRFEKGKAMTRNQQIGAWLALTLLLALALYRWFNLP
jgi:hypothetical protein